MAGRRGVFHVEIACCGEGAFGSETAAFGVALAALLSWLVVKHKHVATRSSLCKGAKGPGSVQLSSVLGKWK